MVTHTGQEFEQGREAGESSLSMEVIFGYVCLSFVGYLVRVLGTGIAGMATGKSASAY